MTQLKHVGVKGMKWGVRKAITSIGSRFDRSLKQKYGVTRGDIKKNASKHFDRSVEQKYGIKDASAKINDKIKKAFTPDLPKVKGTSAFGYKQSIDHATDFAASFKAKKYKDMVIDLTKGTGKLIVESVAGFVIGYGIAKGTEEIFKRL